jgi:NAD dependent epimerase/dehydratase family enzyme
VRLALGEFGDVLLKGQRVLPRRLLAEGFRFAHPGFAAALDGLAPGL